MAQNKNIIIIAILLVLFISIGLTLLIYNKNLSCLNGDQYSEAIKKCSYNLGKKPENIGRQVTSLPDCLEGEAYDTGKCYYDRKGFMPIVLANILFVLLILDGLAIFGFGLYMLFKYLNKEEKGKYINMKAWTDYCRFWARMGKMPMIDGDPLGEFRMLQKRTIKRDDKDFMQAEIQVSGCNDPLFNGNITQGFSLNDKTEMIDANISDAYHEMVPLHAYNQERVKKFPFTSPKNAADRIMEKITDSDMSAEQKSALLAEASKIKPEPQPQPTVIRAPAYRRPQRRYNPLRM